MLANTHFDFMGTNKKSLIIVSAIIVVCIGSFASRGLSQSIDFTGGRNFKVQFENPVEPEQVRELIASKFGDAQRKRYRYRYRQENRTYQYQLPYRRRRQQCRL